MGNEGVRSASRNYLDLLEFSNLAPGEMRRENHTRGNSRISLTATVEERILNQRGRQSEQLGNFLIYLFTSSGPQCGVIQDLAHCEVAHPTFQVTINPHQRVTES